MTALEAEPTTEVPTCHGGLENLDDEHSYWIDDVEGTVPADLEGTFLRNGPGRQRIGGKPYGHWFDGDGMISSFSVLNGDVHFRNRYVRTPKYLEETAAQDIRFRGFGTQIPGGVRHNIGRMPGNPANTNTVLHGGHLLALYEGGRPFELSPDTLDTVGEFDYDGGLTRANTFSAHPKIHPRTGELFNFGPGSNGVDRHGLKMCMNIYRVNRVGELVEKGDIPLDNFPFAHDFAMSDRYAIFFINSIVFGGMGKVMLGLNSISDQITFDPTIPMRVVVVDLGTLTEVRSFETDPGAIIHFGNAYEDGDEIVVDGMFAGDFDVNGTLSDVFHAERFSGGTFRRYRLDIRSGQLSYEQMTDVESEFPTINPKIAGLPNQHTYTATSVDNGANSFFNGFQKVSGDGETTVVTLPPGLYGSEPVFAPAEGGTAEDDGYLMEVVYNGFDHRSELHIHRADDITERVAKLTLTHHLPHQFHGQWHSEVTLDEAKTGR